MVQTPWKSAVWDASLDHTSLSRHSRHSIVTESRLSNRARWHGWRGILADNHRPTTYLYSPIFRIYSPTAGSTNFPIGLPAAAASRIAVADAGCFRSPSR